MFFTVLVILLILKNIDSGLLPTTEPQPKVERVKKKRKKRAVEICSSSRWPGVKNILKRFCNTVVSSKLHLYNYSKTDAVWQRAVHFDHFQT